jgi:oxalate decarboxylase/phosphoglucose isomerase-like protein (cupin superfamily)
MSGKIPILLLAMLAPLASEAPAPELLSLPLECAGGDCPLLQGAPQTAGMVSGFVKLMPGKSVGWHSTNKNEETLVILRGQGAALIKGRPQRTFMAPRFLYIPPDSRHNIVNTGQAALEYVYVVAPVAAK